MPSRLPPALVSGAMRLVVGLAIACACALPAQADYVVLLAGDSAAHAAFARQLQARPDAGERIDVVRLDGPGAGAAAPRADHDHATAGVRTRGIGAPTLPRARQAGPVTIAVGLQAARLALARRADTPLLLAMLSRLDYEALRAEPALLRPERRIGVLLRDPSMAAQLALIDAVLPQRRRLGIAATPESGPLLQDLRRAAAGWDLQVEVAPDIGSLAASLRALLPRSDALLLLPDAIGDSQAATLAVLRAGAGAGLAVFGTSEGLVRSGGLAAVVSTPQQLATQARLLALRLVSEDAGPPWTETPAMPAVRTNPTVARSLGVQLPGERELAQRVATAR